MTGGAGQIELHAGGTEKPPTAARNLDDLQEVLRMYNEVTRRLEVSHERLQAEVVRLTQQLEQKNRELEHKNRLAALGEMAAGIAHEIRNPLGGIQLYASTLAAEVQDRASAAELVRKISDGVKGLNAMVGDMLAFTQNMPLNRGEHDLGELVEAAVELARPGLEEASVRVQLAADLPGKKVNVDARLMGRVLLNLILNAAEAIGETRNTKRGTPTEGVIWIRAEPAGERLELAVEDNGPGIPAHVLEKIFNPFFTTKHKGTGLGLAIVHRIVEAHAGRIRAENTTEGGARFVITL